MSLLTLLESVDTAASPDAGEDEFRRLAIQQLLRSKEPGQLVSFIERDIEIALEELSNLTLTRTVYQTTEKGYEIWLLSEG